MKHNNYHFHFGNLLPARAPHGNETNRHKPRALLFHRLSGWARYIGNYTNSNLFCGLRQLTFPSAAFSLLTLPSL